MSDKLFNTPTEDVVAVVNRDGLTKVARRHRVSRFKLGRWLRENGYIAKHVYVRRDSPVEVQR